MAGEPRRLTFRLAFDRNRHLAICSCGWRSEPASTAGLVGAAWDAHCRRDHPDRDDSER